jgi:hypothetical protein
MARRFGVTIDCHDPALLVAFWSEALGYVPEPAPDGFGTWVDYWSSIGVPEEELAEVVGAESVSDPDGVGPRVWFQVVPEGKVVKNRVHLDIDVGGGRQVPVEARRLVVHAEAERLLALGATRSQVISEGSDHYGEVMADPEGNEFCLH